MSVQQRMCYPPTERLLLPINESSGGLSNDFPKIKHIVILPSEMSLGSAKADLVR
jgi:hypothetical protein